MFGTENEKGFNLQNAEDPFELIPAGVYPAVVAGVEQKITKTGEGAYVKLKFKLSDGKYLGRTVYTNITVENKSETAVKIGLAQLKALAIAAKLPDLANVKLTDLAGKDIGIKIAIEHSDYKNEQENVVKGYEAR